MMTTVQAAGNAIARLRTPLAMIALIATMGSAHCALAQAGQTPSAWAATLAVEVDQRTALEQSNARPAKGTADVIVAWNKALEGRTTGEVKAMDLYLFAGRYDPVWKNDQLDTLALTRLTTRATLMDKQLIATWTQALKDVQGAEVSEIWVAALVVAVNPLFASEKYQAPMADQYFARLKLLPRAAVDKLATVLNKSKAEAALKMVQNDQLFSNATFAQAYFDQAIQAIGLLLAPKK